VAALTIARLAGTVILAYLVALGLPGHTARPVLIPLTALLVAQVTLCQTLRGPAGGGGGRRVAGRALGGGRALPGGAWGSRSWPGWS
jgi:hypothetical protein